MRPLLRLSDIAALLNLKTTRILRDAMATPQDELGQALLRSRYNDGRYYRAKMLEEPLRKLGLWWGDLEPEAAEMVRLLTERVEGLEQRLDKIFAAAAGE